jgi:S-formylglutathione hydrolase FrmB
VSPQRISRRAALTAGLGLAAAAGLAAGAYELVQAGDLPGKYRLAQLTGACGAPPPTPARPLPDRRETRFYSAYRRRMVTMVTLIPTGLPPGGLPVAVVLHGLGADASSAATLVAPALAGTRLAVITADGGSSYWHRRADGDDPQGMILHEVLPRAAALGLRAGRIGLAGWSMGGYGALLLAERLGAAGAAGVAALAPAAFATYQDARQADRRAFDGPADFARNNLFSQLSALRDVPSYIAVGDDDPFAPIGSELRARLQRLTGQPPRGGIEAGCHDDAFWARHFPDALTFLAARR